jgi:HAE1 family hydrophobic/amphiphilic exporter-1
MSSIAEISIKRPTIPLVILVIFILAGSYFGTQLKYELIPDISTTNIVVSTIYPGAGPEEVEKSITIPLEDALATLEGVEEVNSNSMEGSSLVRITLDFDTDPKLALQEAKSKIDQNLNRLPRDIDPPTISRVDLSAIPIITLGAKSNLSATEFFDLLDKIVKPALSQLNGVANISIIGGIEKEIKINISQEKLESKEISLTQVMNAVSNSNMELPAGKLISQNQQISIRTSGHYHNINEILKTTIGYTNDGTRIELSEVAEVYQGAKELTTLARINGEDAVGIEISKQKEANSVDVSEAVHEKLRELENQNKGINLNFITSNDNSIFTLTAAKAVGIDLLLAIILVSAIMLLFLKSYRNTIFVLVTIPTSLIATLLVMYLFNFSLNLISLTALSLVVGSVVDDAIVIIENIHRHMENGKNRMQATIDSMKEIGLTLVSTTAVLAAVFIPISLVSGMTGQILHEYAVTIVVAMLFSLLFTFTFVPLLTSRFAKIDEHSDNLLSKFLDKFEHFLNYCANWTTSLLKLVLKRKIITFFFTLVLFAVSVYLVPAGYIGASFMDAGDRGNAILRIEFSKDVTIEKNSSVTKKIESIILSNNNVEKLYTTIGKRTGSVVGQSSGTTKYYTEFNIIYNSSEEREHSSNIITRQLRAKIEGEFPEVKVSAANVNLIGNEDIPIQIFLRSNSQKTIRKASPEVIEMLKGIDGTTEIESSATQGNPEYQIHFNRNKMAHYGLNIGAVSRTIQIAFSGNTDNKFRKDDNEYDINIKFDDFNRKDKSDIENLSFNTNYGKIKLSQFATVSFGTGPTVLERFNRSPSTNIKCQIVGSSQGQVQSEFDNLVQTKGLPQGTSFAYSGLAKLMAESFISLGIAFIAAIIFMYLIMVLLYNNWFHPFIVLFTVPFAIIGALWGLALSNQDLSLFTILGIIMLSGLVAKNTILIIDFANELLNSGKSLVESLEEAVRLRFRAILMTNISMIIGLIPLAISTGAGAEWKNGVGWVLIGGLTVSMFLSLILVPLVYYVFEKIRIKLSGKAK